MIDQFKMSQKSSSQKAESPHRDALVRESNERMTHSFGEMEPPPEHQIEDSQLFVEDSPPKNEVSAMERMISALTLQQDGQSAPNLHNEDHSVHNLLDQEAFSAVDRDDDDADQSSKLAKSTNVIERNTSSHNRTENSQTR